MNVRVIQYLRPDGRTEPMETDVSDDCRAAYIAMGHAGLNLAAEVLTTGEVSLTIEDRNEGEDLDCIVVGNGPAVQPAIETMLKRWYTR